MANCFVNSKKWGEYIHYKTLLLAIRDATLSEDEVLFLRKSYRINPVQDEIDNNQEAEPAKSVSIHLMDKIEQFQSQVLAD